MRDVRKHSKSRDPRIPPPTSAAVSKSMRSNRGKGTGPEMNLRSHLWENGIRGYRCHLKTVPGRPDIAFPRKKVAIFINGCFWHRCQTCRLPTPKSHREYWKKKFRSNVARDRRNIRVLEDQGWLVLTIWECEIKDNIESCLTSIFDAIETGDAQP